MSNMKINWIFLQNFKGFMHLNLIFDGGQAVVLGGPNGYGKTTVFDALEILFTGKIKRLNDYLSLHNKSTSMDQEVQIPLVCNAKSDLDVIVRSGIQIDDHEIILERHAKVKEMRNPVDFEPFKRVFFSDNGLDGLREIIPEYLHEIGLVDIAGNYDFLYYLSQEETISFLKMKESERSQLIQQLFDTSRYEIPIQRLVEASKQVSRLSFEYTQQQKVIQEEIMQLNSSVASCQKAKSLYVSLSPDKTLKWDLENPGFSHEDFNTWLTDGGVIDGMFYFCKNKDSFRQNNLNKALNKLLQGDLIKQIVVYFQYKDSSMLRDYKDYFELKGQFECLRMENIGTFKLNLPLSLIVNNVVPASVIESLENIRVRLVSLYNTTTEMGNLKSDMLQRREELAQFVVRNQEKLQTEKCPLCGARYNDSTELMQHVDAYGRLLSQSLDDISHIIISEFEKFRNLFVLKVIEPCEAFYSANEINYELMSFFDNINVSQVLLESKKLERILGRTIVYSRPTEEMVSELSRQLSEKMIPIDASVNVGWLEQIYNSYLKELNWKCLTYEMVKSKRDYLTMLWNKKISETLKDKLATNEKLQRYIDCCEMRNKLYRKTKRSLEKQRNKYVEDIISDMKILFYIYSGRIMQDCYYGRGLLMKPDFSKKRILFVSNSYKSDVDALYTMSSGQLVSLSIAFLLTLNKLYANCLLLAIDDPVQTIDDLNLWGLIETLRHDFNQHFLLLSTHEQDYSQLLTNKLIKWGIETINVDMEKARK